MYKIVFPALLLFSLSVHAQGIDFDKEFPLSENDLYYPLIGENGELPSELEQNNDHYTASPEEIRKVEESLRLEQENAYALEEPQNSVYQEPTTALGYQPHSDDAPINAQSEVQKPAAGAKSFSIDDLKRTVAPKKITTEAELIEAEKSITSMEQTIESLIGSNADAENASVQENQARPLVEFPKLTENNNGDNSFYGLYTKETGGFDSTVWQGINRKQADKFFADIQKSKLESFTVKNELIKLLLTKAPEPKGESDTNWLAARTSVLHGLGEVSRAGLLISSAGVNIKNVNSYKNIAQTWVENGLMHGNDRALCPFVRQNILNTDNPFWRKALLVCQLLSRDLKGLELSTNMLTEEIRRTDPLLFSLFDTIQGLADAPMLSPIQKLNPLHSVIYAESPLLLTPNVIPLLPDAILRRVAKNVALPLTVRLQAAEILVNNFSEMNDIALLGLLYEKAEFDEEIIASPGVDRYADEEVDGSLARALLWQGSKTSGLPSTRALTLKALWERADRDNLFRLAARLTPNLRQISADSNLAWLSPEVINRSLKYGNIETAQKWWKTLQKNRSLSRDLMVRRDSLEIVFAFIDGELPETVFEKWIESKSLFDENDRTELQRTLTFLEASEIDFPSDIWQKLHETMDESFTEQGKDASPLWLRLLGSNLESQNVAGSFILLTDPLLKANMNDLSEQTAGNIVTGFRFLGMNETANKLILEAIISLK